MILSKEVAIALAIAILGSLLLVLVGLWQAILLPCAVAGYVSKKIVRGLIVGLAGGLGSLLIITGRLMLLSPGNFGRATEAGFLVVGLPLGIAMVLGVLGGIIGALVYRTRTS